MNPPDDDDPHGSPYSTGRPNARISVIVPPADLAAAMREALEGPEESRDIKGAETQTRCPTCAGTGLCSPSVAAEVIRLRSASRPPEDPTR